MAQRQTILGLYNSRIAGRQDIRYVNNRLDNIQVLYEKMVKPTLYYVDNKKDYVLELYNKNAAKYQPYMPNFETQ